MIYIVGRSRDPLPLQTRITIYKAYIRPLMEYASPIWSGAGITALKLLDRLQKKALRLLNIDEPAMVGIHPLEHRRKVVSLCPFYRHFFLQPSTELSRILPPVATNTRVTRSTSNAHPHAVNIPKSTTNLHLSSYIPRTSRLWNSLPSTVFPSDPNMDAFKSAVNLYLLNHF